MVLVLEPEPELVLVPALAQVLAQVPRLQMTAATGRSRT